MRYPFAVQAALIAAMILSGMPVGAQISKGHQILMDHGVQSTGMITKDDVFNLTTYQDAGFSAANWMWVSDNSKLGTAPGVPWMRWVASQADMPPVGGEAPYMSNLLAVSMADEQDLNDPTVRAGTAAWYGAVRASFPNTILFSNSYGGQLTNPSLEDFINTSHPDMLSFDTYPFGTGGPAGGSPTNLYGDMQRYRKFALAHGLPYAMYTQTYHASSEARRDPSDSELRLNYFAGVAFGYTFFSAFTYNTGASSLFTSPGGDSNPTALMPTMKDINARLKKMSPVLTRIKSSLVNKANPGNPADIREVGIMCYPGQHVDNGTTVSNATPIDFSVYPGDFSAFYQNTNDPWLRGVTVTNIGNKNDGLRGDVFMCWFKVLDESLDGSASNEIYVMILNGLTDPTGSAADCRQRVKLNYLSNAPAQLKRLNQQTGLVETISNPLDTVSGRRLPSFDIDGGCCELYKFDTGAPFVGVDVSSTREWMSY